MLNFPDWSDLSKVSAPTRMTWEGAASLAQKYFHYFSGNIFQDKIPLDQPIEGEIPLLYPVGLNLIKMLCLAQADAEFGEWDDHIVTFEVKGEDDTDKTGLAAIEIANNILERSNGNTLLWETSLDRNIYGGAAIKIAPTLEKPAFIHWQKVPVGSFFPVPDPDSIDKLLEVWVMLEMTVEQAKARYGITTNNDRVIRVEHWTPSYYENFVDGKRIDTYSESNPWGFVPFVYIPRYRGVYWWGDALTEDLIAAQDEMNMRIADIGEAINYNAHPVRWGYNLPKSFTAKNYPLDPNSLWDLGRSIGNSPRAEVGIMEAAAAVAPGVFEYVNFLYDWTRTSSFAPPIAFGEDNGGGQRSGATLEIRMWPLIKAVRRSRSYLRDGLRQLLTMSAKILQQKSMPEVSPRALDRLVKGTLDVSFADLMPKDHVSIVDEVVKLMSTNPPSISIETAQKILGRNPSEIARVEKMLAQFKEYMKPDNQLTNGMKGKVHPQSEAQ